MQAASEQTLELRLSRYVGGGLHEDVGPHELQPAPTAFELELELDADFADQERDARRAPAARADSQRPGGTGRRRGAGLRLPGGAPLRPRAAGARRIDRGRPHPRAAVGLAARPTRTAGSPSASSCAPRGDLARRASTIMPEIEGGESLPASTAAASFASTDNEHDRRRERSCDESTSFATPRERDAGAGRGRRARAGPARPREPAPATTSTRGERGWTLAAGLPIYVALFGRDTLTAAWQAALLGPEMMRGTLAVLARLQGREVDDWRDEQPGRMLHEAHTGPLAAAGLQPAPPLLRLDHDLRLLPRSSSRSCGTGRATRDLVRPFVEPGAATPCAGSTSTPTGDGDGFYEYRTRSSQGVEAPGAGRTRAMPSSTRTARPVEPPIATCEEQAFVYVAKLHLSEMLWWLDEKDEAAPPLPRGGGAEEALQRRLLDGGRGLLRHGARRAGPADPLDRLEPRPLPGRRASSTTPWSQRTAARLFAPRPLQRLGHAHALDATTRPTTPTATTAARSGRSSTAASPWASCATGSTASSSRSAGPSSRPPACFDFYRLPEVFSGHARDADHPFPALYPQTNSPQAWSASAVFCLVQSHARPLPLRAAEDAAGRPAPARVAAGDHAAQPPRRARRWSRSASTARATASDYEILDSAARCTSSASRAPGR